MYPIESRRPVAGYTDAHDSSEQTDSLIQQSDSSSLDIVSGEGVFFVLQHTLLDNHASAAGASRAEDKIGS